MEDYPLYLNRSWSATLATLTATASRTFQQDTQMSKILFVFMPLNTVCRKRSTKPSNLKTRVSITFFLDQEVTRRRTAHVFGKSTPLT